MAAVSAPGPDEQEVLKRRRRRSVALAIVLAALAAIFYALTIAKIGPGVFNRAL